MECEQGGIELGAIELRYSPLPDGLQGEWNANKPRIFELKRLFFLDLSMADRRLHDDLRKIYSHLKAQRFDLHRPCS